MHCAWLCKRRTRSGTVLSRFQHGERGQTIPLFALSLTALIIITGVVIDGGNFLWVRRDMQGQADAGALAGIYDIATSEGAAEATATYYAELEDGALVQDVNCCEDTDEGSVLTITVHRQTDGFFAGFLGLNPDIKASASTVARSMTGTAKMLPMALMEGTYTNLASEEIKFDTAQSNRGPINLPMQGDGCGLSSGGADFANLIRTSENGGDDGCIVDTSVTVSTESGNMSGPTKQGMDDRIGANNDTFDDVFELDPVTNMYRIINPDSPRLGFVPVVLTTTGSNEWPAGNKDLQIVTFVPVFIEDYAANGKNITVIPVENAYFTMEPAHDVTWGSFVNDGTTPANFRLVA